jgi:hypothetical protein
MEMSRTYALKQTEGAQMRKYNEIQMLEDLHPIVVTKQMELSQLGNSIQPRSRSTKKYWHQKLLLGSTYL